MASKFILQGVTEDSHLEHLKQLLSIPNPVRIVISTAFMTETGLKIIEDALLPIAKKTVIFVGIRNGITTAQGLIKAIDLGCEVYAVDTGKRMAIFHPKIYLAMSKSEAGLISGSANLTRGGLVSNIEASISLVLDLADKQSGALVEDITTKLDQMISEYPDNVIRLSKINQVKELLDAARVADESVRIIPSSRGTAKSRAADGVPSMRLKTKHPVSKKKPKQKVPKTKPARRKIVKIENGPKLVWKLNALVRRDLSIPKSTGTSLTGSMLFKKGDNEIDTRTYFREDIFQDLDWNPDTRTKGKELAEGTFQIIIRSIDYGTYNLTVTHDTRTDTKTYKQNQPMSAIKWGLASSIIRKEDLLDRSIFLYKDYSSKGHFIIEID